MKSALLLIIIFFAAGFAEGAMIKSTRKLPLGETEVQVNIYENAGANITFFAPHHNEQIGLNLAREFVQKNGGRLVEIESYDDRGKPSRYIKFKLNNKTYTIDPNRIFTANGRSCGVSAEIAGAVKIFADSLLPAILAADGRSLRDKERFIVAVHNNTDVSAKNADAQTGNLTAAAFIKAQSGRNLAHGAFEAQADGVFLSNTETDEDNFVFLSTPAHIGHFAAYGFNVVVQKTAAKLQSKQCAVDDGSLSVYAAQNAVQYICLEADGASGALRQRRMFQAVYALLPDIKDMESEALASRN